jgi:hypothetical protein
VSTYAYIVRCEKCHRDIRFRITNIKLDRDIAMYILEHDSTGITCCNDNCFEIIELSHSKTFKKEKEKTS